MAFLITAATLAVVIAVGLSWRWRKQRQASAAALALQLTPIPPVVARALAVVPVSQPRRRSTAAGHNMGVTVATDAGRLTCPTCLREFHGQRYCTSDARRLAPSHEVRSRGRGVICLGCHRAYDAGLSQCPHDSLALVPHSIQGPATGRRARGLTQPAHVQARICPLCGTRDDLHARFCGRDGAALLVIN